MATAEAMIWHTGPETLAVSSNQDNVLYIHRSYEYRWFWISLHLMYVLGTSDYSYVFHKLSRPLTLKNLC